MSQLLVLVLPLMHMMLMTVILGSLGYLATTAISVYGVYAVLKGPNISLISILIGLVLISAIAKYFEQLSGHYIAFKLLAQMRDQVFQKLRELAPAKLEGKEKGNLIAMITTDIELIEVFYAHTIAPILIALITSLVMVLFLTHFHMLLGLLALCAYLTIGLLIPIYNNKKGKDTGMAYRNAFGTLNNILLENMRGLFEILQFNQGQARNDLLSKASQALSDENKKLKHLEGSSKALTEMVLLVFGIGALFLSLALSLGGHLASNDVIIVMVAFLGSFGPTSALSALSNDLMQTLASGERLLNLLEEKPEVNERTIGAAINQEAFRNISCEGISFSYKQTQVLKGVTAQFEKGKITGIHGKSGSGKSTLLKLMMRFWDTDEGEVIYKGSENVPIKALSTPSLRSLTSYMTQETYLFNGTLKENIAIGKANATDEAIISAAKKAALHEFVCKLPKGYDSKVGELGSFLSGGERQRIGLARAFISEAPIMLLDEPTSNLDSLNEALLLNAIENSAREKCVVLVSHRASTLGLADQMLKISGGILSQ